MTTSDIYKSNIAYSIKSFFSMLPGYMWLRGNQMRIFTIATLEVISITFNIIKTQLVSRMFWGRGSLYKNMFHLIMLSFTMVALLIGLSARFLFVQANEEGLQTSYGQGATNDLLQQGGSITTVLAVDPLQPEIEIREYEVRAGDSLEQIADWYGVSMDTIRWANSDLISPFGNAIEVGWTLKVPEIDGVMYRVRNGQTLDSIASVTGGNRIDIIELNGLVPPDYAVVPGQYLFVPNGQLSQDEIVVAGIPQGVFDNPLSHPNCAGYTYSRGYTGYHNGLDLARFPGCPIRAIATGVVVFAGWSPLAGFNVRIDHGGGITSHYYHSDGTFWVKVGDRVQQGQEIMMMGTSGNSTGVHLHLSLFKDGYAVNPALFVPF